VKDRKDKAMSNETNDASKMDLSRRNVLKVAVAGLLAGVAVPLFLHLSSIHAAARGTGRKKVLIVYYSRSGNTREIASQIHRSVGGDIFEIQVVEPYPEDYEEVKKIAMQEQQSGFKPALKTKVKNFGSCDVIFVGTPIGGVRYPLQLNHFYRNTISREKQSCRFARTEEAVWGEVLRISRHFVRIQLFWMVLPFGGKM